MNRLACAVGTASLFLSSLGAAQPADVPRTEPAPASEGSAEAAPIAAPAEVPVLAPVFPAQGRFRFGIAAGLGTFFPGPMISYGLAGRAGWQFTNILGAYATFGKTSGLWLGGSLNVGSGGASISQSVSFVDYWQFGLEGEAILGNRFYVAAGPKIVNGGWGFIAQSVGGGSGGASVNQTAGVVSGWLPAVGTRIGLAFGKPNPETGRRGGFNMAIDTTFVFGSGGVKVNQSAGGTGISQSVAPLGGVGITPMLTFGYELR